LQDLENSARSQAKKKIIAEFLFYTNVHAAI